MVRLLDSLERGASRICGLRVRGALAVPLALLHLSLLSSPVAAQYQTRAEEIEAARKEKAKNLKPDIPSKTERALVYIKENRIIERITGGIAGLRVKMGGLATGSGFAFGPEYLRRDLADGAVRLRSSASISTRGWQLYDAQLTFPRLADGHLLVDLYALHRNFSGINYYGPGPDSQKSGRSNYRLEDTSYDGTLDWSPVRHLHLGVTGGLLQVNVGPGADDRFVSAERIYSPSQAPGIDRQTDFLRGGGILQYDWRDNPEGPRTGGNYFARYTAYSDRDLERFSFQRIDLEAQQYLPFFNARRVIALRGRTALTNPRGGNTVPFYLQPNLGGSDDLRGFRPFRFHDNNMMVFNGEYRWEVFSGMDMAIFGDAGKVFTRRADWNLEDLESSYGFGMRFNARNDVFMRIDVGFSHEGFQVWFKFNNVF